MICMVVSGMDILGLYVYKDKLYVNDLVAVDNHWRMVSGISKAISESGPTLEVIHVSGEMRRAEVANPKLGSAGI